MDNLVEKKSLFNKLSTSLKKIASFFRRQKKILQTSQVKKDILRLEEERSKEKAALLKQRHFYEGLLKKDVEVEAPKIVPKEISQTPIIEEVKPMAQPEVIISKETKTTKDITQPTTPKLLPKKFLWFSGHGSLAKKLALERVAEESVRQKNEVEDRSWQAFNCVKGNLIKDQGVLFFNWKEKVLTLVLSLVLCSLGISLVYVGLLIWQKERLSYNQTTLANYDAINVEIAKNEREIQDIVTFNKKLDLVNYLLSNHIYWSKFFGFLEGNTLKDITLSSFSGDLTGDYKIPALARNLDAVSAQLEVMKAYNLVKGVQYSGAQASGSNIKFMLELAIDPKVFIK